MNFLAQKPFRWCWKSWRPMWRWLKPAGCHLFDPKTVEKQSLDVRFRFRSGRCGRDRLFHWESTVCGALGGLSSSWKTFSTLNSGFKQNFSQFSCKFFGLASGDPVVAAEGHSRERNVLDRVHGVVQRCNQRIESETLVAFSCQKNQGTHSSKVDNAPHHSLEIKY